MRKIVLFIMLLLAAFSQSFAQVYPVQVTPQLSPPYSLIISDYYSGTATGAEKLRVMLLNRDLQRTSLEVRLRLTIESQSLRIRTREDVVLPAFTLQSGTPYYVAPSDMAAYFNAANLEFSGISREQYEETGKLPEGFYTFSIEAVETVQGKTVSNKGTAFAWMTLSDPPFLNMPAKGESLTPRTPQNIIFQWTPRQMAAPNAGYSTDYVFSLVEIADPALTPEAAFTTYAPLFTDSVHTTTYLYDATKPALVPGKRYGWRVQAKTKSGLEDLALFRNGGYSEVWVFTYQNTCPLPQGIGTTLQGQTAMIAWQANPVHLEYKVDYREKNNAAAEWFSLTNTIPSVLLADLKPSKEYEYRVGAACEYGILNYTDLLSFTTNSASVSNVPNCGDTSGIESSLPQTLLPALNPGDIIRTGDFDAVVTEATGGGGVFSGKGYIKVPWLLNMKVDVRFDNITVNADKKLVTGIIKTAYDPTEKNIVSVNEFLSDLAQLFNDLGGFANDIRGMLANLNNNHPPTAQQTAEMLSYVSANGNNWAALVGNASGESNGLIVTSGLEQIKQGLECLQQSTGYKSYNNVSHLSGPAPSEEWFTDCSAQLQEGLSKLDAAQQTLGDKINSETTEVEDNEDIDDPDDPTSVPADFYVAPNGRPVKLPAGSEILNVCYEKTLYPDGALLGFLTPDGKRYVAKILKSGSPVFLGYFEIDATRKLYTSPANGYKDNITLSGTQLEVNLLLRKEEGNAVSITKQLATYLLTDGVKKTTLYQSSDNVLQSLEDYTLGSVVKTYTVNQCRPEMSPLSYYVTNGKLKEWLAGKGITNAEIYVADCSTGGVTKVTASGQEASSLTTAQAKAKVLNKTFSSKYAIYACIGSNGKWEIESNFNSSFLPNSKFKESKSTLENEVKEQAKEEIAERNAQTGGKGTGTSAAEKYKAGNDAADGEFYKEGMGMLEAVTAVYEFGEEVITEARMPEGVWNQQEQPDKYNKYPFHMPPLMAGAGDQVIDEATGTIQLLKLGYQVVRHPQQTASGMWGAVKKMRPSDIRKLIITDEAIANYNKGGMVSRHQGGKDGVRVAMAVFTLWKTAAKSGKEIIEKGGDEADEIVETFDHLDDIAKNSYNHAINEEASVLLQKELHDADGVINTIETGLVEARDISITKGRKLTWPEVKALFKRGNDFNAKGRLGYPNNEVTIEHAILKNADGSPKRFRVDSYVENTVIVSRKATDLSNIQQSTFEGYLKELVDKYSPGGRIVSPSNPNVNGKILSGNLKLEIPSSNKNFSSINYYKQIANNFNYKGATHQIEIIFLDE